MGNLLSNLLNFVRGISKNVSQPDPADVEEVINEVSATDITDKITPQLLKSNIFVYTPLENIQNNLPLLIKALKSDSLDYKEMLCYAFATLFVENTKFKPVAEQPSQYSSKSKVPPYDFSNYIGKGGNTNIEEASLYRGSGFIQLTTKENYAHWDVKLNLDGGLIKDGYKAGNEPHIASYIFSGYLKEREEDIVSALKQQDFKLARTFVNGKAALHWKEFRDAYLKLSVLLD